MVEAGEMHSPKNSYKLLRINRLSSHLFSTSQCGIFFPCIKNTRKMFLLGYICMWLHEKEIKIQMHAHMYVHICMSVCVWVTIRGLLSSYVPMCAWERAMNNSRHVMLSAEASTPDRGWNIHANLVGRDCWGTAGEREENVKNRQTVFKRNIIKATIWLTLI